LDLDYFLGLEGRANIRVFPTLFGSDGDIRAIMMSHLSKGADGYCLWDGAHGEIFKPLYNLGFEDASHHFTPETKQRTAIPLLRLAIFRVDRYHQWECF
jgi:hypothetical protein